MTEKPYYFKGPYLHHKNTIIGSIKDTPTKKKIETILNNQHTQIQQLEQQNTTTHNTIQNMLKTERTHIGQSVLQQLQEQLK